MIKIKFVPHEAVQDDFKKVFKALQTDSLVLIDAKLGAEQEAELIKQTMEEYSDEFPGIEVSSLGLPNNISGLTKFRRSLAEILTGKKRGFTIIGPAHIVKKIKKNPRELLLYM